MALLPAQRQDIKGDIMPIITNNTYRLDTRCHLGGAGFAKHPRRQAHKAYYKGYYKQLITQPCFFK